MIACRQLCSALVCGCWAANQSNHGTRQTLARLDTWTTSRSSPETALTLGYWRRIFWEVFAGTPLTTSAQPSLRADRQDATSDHHARWSERWHQCDRDSIGCEPFGTCAADTCRGCGCDGDGQVHDSSVPRVGQELRMCKRHVTAVRGPCPRPTLTRACARGLATQRASYGYELITCLPVSRRPELPRPSVARSLRLQSCSAQLACFGWVCT